MKIFMTGADGFIGTVISQKLREKGHTVRGLVRSDEAVQRLTLSGDEPIRGDLNRVDLLTEEAHNADGVIHLALANPPAGIELDKQVVEAMLNAMVGTNRPFIYTSGALVTGDTGNGVTDETALIDFKGATGWRGQHEEIVTLFKDKGVRGLVIRPASIVYGNGGGGTVTRMLESARKTGAAAYVGDGHTRKSTVHVDDLANLYLLALEKAAAGEVFIGAGDEIIKTGELAEAVSRAVGAGGKTVSISYEQAHQQMGFLADIQVMNCVVSSAKARRVLGWQPHGPTLIHDLENGVNFS